MDLEFFNLFCYSFLSVQEFAPKKHKELLLSMLCINMEGLTFQNKDFILNGCQSRTQECWQKVY